MSTIRAGRMPRSSACATFVSGPTATSTVSGPMRSTRKSTAVLLDGLGGARRQLGPVETAVAVNVGGDVGLTDERSVGAHRDGNVLAADEGEHPQRVVGRLLERLVAVHGGDADEARSPGSRARARARSRRRARGRSRGGSGCVTAPVSRPPQPRSGATVARRSARRRPHQRRRRGAAPPRGRGPRAARRAGTP